MTGQKSVCVITGTRAEYGLLMPLIDRLYKDEAFELRLVVTGSHLSPAFGETWCEVEDDGYPIHQKIPMELDSDTQADMARATGLAVVSFTGYFEANRPDIVVVLGDRFELLSVAIAAAMLRIPIAHIGGGDTSEGAVDEFIRHSITKMSYLHFPTNEESRRRVIQLGENPDRVFNVGALNVENILSRTLMTREELGANLDLNACNDYALVTFHSATLEEDVNASACRELLKAVDQFPDMRFIFTKANADSGGRAINALLEDFVVSRVNCVLFSSLGNLRYLSAMKYATMVVGNSSSGLYETPALGVPCVNIGDRQRGRLRAGNVIDCAAKAEAIIKAMKDAGTAVFKEKARVAENPFGDGKTAERILKILKENLFNGRINLRKEFYSHG